MGVLFAQAAQDALHQARRVDAQADEKLGEGAQVRELLGVLFFVLPQRCHVFWVVAAFLHPQGQVEQVLDEVDAPAAYVSSV